MASMSSLKETNDTKIADPVSHYTDFFMRLAKPEEIFPPFKAAIPQQSYETSVVIGSLWYHLSEAIVDYLCTSLAKLENPYIRHFVVQTAYEELGEESEDKLHTDLLRHTLKVAGIHDNDILEWSGEMDVKASLDTLHAQLDECQTDAEIAGLLLGLEIIAFENIQNVVDSISYSEEVAARVLETDWVRMHNVMEEAHIRRAVSVFVRFMPDLTSQRKFVHRFSQAMDFWKAFWGSVAQAASRNAGVMV